jgi:DNA-binding NarL/FixJ family response regulator
MRIALQPAHWMVQKVQAHLIKVALVDDNRTALQSLQEVVTYSPKTRVIFTTRSGNEFLEKMKSLPVSGHPDVVIMDVNMPGMNGIETVRQAKMLYPNVKFLMLTVFDDEETLFEAIQAGASGYLLKDENALVIVSHIHTLKACRKQAARP